MQPKVGGKSHLKLNTCERPIANKYREGKMKRTLRRESKAPETVGREAMDAGDPLLEAVCGARVGARRAVANRDDRSASVCCHVAGRRKAFGGVVGGCPSLSVSVPYVRCGRGPGRRASAISFGDGRLVSIRSTGPWVGIHPHLRSRLVSFGSPDGV
jgi:hypothetical protein